MQYLKVAGTRYPFAYAIIGDDVRAEIRTYVRVGGACAQPAFFVYSRVYSKQRVRAKTMAYLSLIYGVFLVSKITHGNKTYEVGRKTYEVSRKTYEVGRKTYEPGCTKNYEVGLKKNMRSVAGQRRSVAEQRRSIAEQRRSVSTIMRPKISRLWSVVNKQVL